MFFFGEQIERVGPRSYRLTRGAFTSCVQPTPRWEVVSSTIDINLDNHVLLRNAVIEVKGVPVLFLPWMYFPIQEDGRATGLMMPTYGTSTYRGTSISNAFFWAIGRSQDATAFHDLFTSSGGHGLGGEYRYTRGSGSNGDARYYFLDEPGGETTYQAGRGSCPNAGATSFAARRGTRWRRAGTRAGRSTTSPTSRSSRRITPTSIRPPVRSGRCRATSAASSARISSAGPSI